jgi:hypothetical protein
MITFDTSKLVDYKASSVLYWYGISDDKGALTYCLMFNGHTNIVSTRTKENSFGSAEYLMVPIVCIN